MFLRFKYVFLFGVSCLGLGPGPQGVGGRGGAGGTPDWTGQRFGGFPGQRGFQRG